MSGRHFTTHSEYASLRSCLYKHSLGLVLFAENIVTSIAPKYKILQGYEALKPSHLYGEVVVEGDQVCAVKVAGEVVKVGQGEIEIP